MPIAERVYSLSYAIRFWVVMKYLGQLSLVIAVLTLVPFATAYLFHDYALCLRLAVVIAVFSSIGLLARGPTPDRLETHEALIITALIFVLVPLAMVFPLMEQGVSFPDALFEATSAITTTGLTTIETVSDKSAGFLFTRAWMQWYGGLGIVILSMALLFQPGAAARRLVHTAMEGEDLITSTRLHARRVLQVYLVLTLTGMTALWLTGVDPYSALLHALAGVSTGGFSNHDDSIAELGGWSSQAVLMLFSFFGAISLALYHPANYHNWRRHMAYLELKGLAVVSLAAILGLGACMLVVGQSSWFDTLLHAPLVAVSAQTGTGFTSTSIEHLDPASKLVLILSMFIGGGMGSTAGGIKILRLLILLRLLQLMIQRTCMPAHAVLEPRLMSHRLDNREIEHALLIILIFVMVVFLSWMPFLVMGYAPLDALFEVVSATATVGLSTGIASTELPAFLKGVLSLDMVLGRLEVVALVLVLYPRTWFGKRSD